MDLTGLGAFGSTVYGGQLDARDARLGLRAKEMDLRNREQDLAAERAFAGWLSSAVDTGIPYAQPMPQPAPVGPGQPSAPFTGPGGRLVGGEAASSSFVAQPSPTSAVPQGAPVTPAMLPPAFTGGLDIRAMARQIEQANPGIDKATLFRAIQKGANVLNPESKIAMQYATAMMRLEMQQDALTARLEQTRMNDDTRMWISRFVQNAMSDRAAAGRATTERGQDIRAGTAERGQDIRSSDAAAARAVRDAKAGPAKEYNTLSTQLRSVTAEISDLIRESGGMVPAPGTKNWDKYNTLKARRDALFERMVAARKKAEAAGQAVSMSPAETTKEDEAKGPKAGDIEDGYRFKGGDPADQKNWEKVQ